jgi:hypothetical protein
VDPGGRKHVLVRCHFYKLKNDVQWLLRGKHRRSIAMTLIYPMMKVMGILYFAWAFLRLPWLLRWMWHANHQRTIVSSVFLSCLKYLAKLKAILRANVTKCFCACKWTPCSHAWINTVCYDRGRYAPSGFISSTEIKLSLDAYSLTLYSECKRRPPSESTSFSWRPKYVLSAMNIGYTVFINTILILRLRAIYHDNRIGAIWHFIPTHLF